MARRRKFEYLNDRVYGAVLVRDLRPGMIVQFYGEVISVSAPYEDNPGEPDTTDVVVKAKGGTAEVTQSWWSDHDILVEMPDLFVSEKEEMER